MPISTKMFPLYYISISCYKMITWTLPWFFQSNQASIRKMTHSPLCKPKSLTSHPSTSVFTHGQKSLLKALDSITNPSPPPASYIAITFLSISVYQHIQQVNLDPCRWWDAYLSWRRFFISPGLSGLADTWGDVCRSFPLNISSGCAELLSSESIIIAVIKLARNGYRQFQIAKLKHPDTKS